MNKIFKISFLIVGIILIIGGGFFLWQKYGWQIGIDNTCFKIEEHNITGYSMEPLLVSGEKVKGLVGYYDCNEVKRDQVAIIKFKTREESFVKKVVGLPGDLVEFENNQLKLNGKLLNNTQGEPYLFSEASKKIITIPLNNGKIQEGRYLVLGEEKGENAFDSRQFGFIEKEHLKGRVIKDRITSFINLIKETCQKILFEK